MLSRYAFRDLLLKMKISLINGQVWFNRMDQLLLPFIGSVANYQIWEHIYLNKDLKSFYQD